MENKECKFCNKYKKEEYFVTELKTGYVLISCSQYFEGYTLFVYKNHLTELHEIEDIEKEDFLREMSLVAEAVYRTFKPKKLNYAMLGNKDAHMHWHLIPRYGTDPKPENVIWAIPPEVWIDSKPTEEKLRELKEKLKTEIELLKNK